MEASEPVILLGEAFCLVIPLSNVRSRAAFCRVTMYLTKVDRLGQAAGSCAPSGSLRLVYEPPTRLERS